MKKIYPVALFTSGISVLFVAIVALAGYFFDYHAMTDWNQDTKMALPTAVCFIAIGGVMVFIALTLNEHEKPKP